MPHEGPLNNMGTTAQTARSLSKRLPKLAGNTLKALVPHVLFMASIRLYHELVLSHDLPPRETLLDTEAPLLLVLFATCYWLLKPSWLRAVVAAMPIYACA